MKTYKNKHYVKRDYEATNVVCCQAEKPPNDSWIECDKEELIKLTSLYARAGIKYYGYM